MINIYKDTRLTEEPQDNELLSTRMTAAFNEIEKLKLEFQFLSSTSHQVCDMFDSHLREHIRNETETPKIELSDLIALASEGIISREEVRHMIGLSNC